MIYLRAMIHPLILPRQWGGTFCLNPIPLGEGTEGRGNLSDDNAPSPLNPNNADIAQKFI